MGGPKDNMKSSTSTPTEPNGLEPEARAYGGEAIGGYGVAGTRHDGPSQDAFSPSSETGQHTPTKPSSIQTLLAGLLYLFADGVTLCADGYEASRLAVQVVANVYYEQAGAFEDTSREREERLAEAIWQAHKAVQQWDEKLFCWREGRHLPQHFSPQEVKRRRGTQALCPECGKPLAGLQTTLVAALLHGCHLTVLKVGPSVALRLPADAKEPLEVLADSDQRKFLGMPGLSEQDFDRQDIILQPGDRVVLCGDGLIETLKEWLPGQAWKSYLRRQLSGENLQQATKDLIGQLHRFRQENAPHLDDDLTLLVVAVPEQATLNQWRTQVKKARERLSRKWLESNEKLEPDAFDPFIKHARVLLLHEPKPDANLWRKYGAALREKALAEMRKSGGILNEDAVNLMRDAAQVGDALARRWCQVIEIVQQIVDWGRKNPILLAKSAQWHEQVTEMLKDMNVVQTLPDVQRTLRSQLNPLKKELKNENQLEAAAHYERLFQEWEEAIESQQHKKHNGKNGPLFASQPPSSPSTVEPADSDDEEEAGSEIEEQPPPEPPPEPPALRHETHSRRLSLSATITDAKSVLCQLASLPVSGDRRDLAKMIELMDEVTWRCSVTFYVLRDTWQALWLDPTYEFQLYAHSFPPSYQESDFYRLTQLAELLPMVAKVDEILQRAVTFDPRDEQAELAQTDLRKLAEFPEERFKEQLPPAVGLIPLMMARKLAEARYYANKLRWKQALQSLQDEPPCSPCVLLEQARDAYAQVIRQAFQAPDGTLSEDTEFWRLLNNVEWWRERFPEAKERQKEQPEEQPEEPPEEPPEQGVQSLHEPRSLTRRARLHLWLLRHIRPSGQQKVKNKFMLYLLIASVLLAVIGLLMLSLSLFASMTPNGPTYLSHHSNFMPGKSATLVPTIQQITVSSTPTTRALLVGMFTSSLVLVTQAVDQTRSQATSEA